MKAKTGMVEMAARGIGALCLLAAVSAAFVPGSAVARSGAETARTRPAIERFAFINPWPALATADFYREAADSGVTVLCQAVGDEREAVRCLDLARNSGVKLGLFCPALMEHEPEKLAAAVKDHPALGLYYLKDEPKAGELDGLGALAARVRAVDPRHPVYVNLFGILYDDALNEGVLGTGTFDEYCRTAVSKLKDCLLSFDVYPIYCKRFDAEPFRFPKGPLILDDRMLYGSLEVLRETSESAGRPFWGFALAVAVRNHETLDNPVATVSDMKLQQYSNLAYGAQGIEWYSYVTPGKACPLQHHLGVLTEDLLQNPIYDRMREVNREIAAREHVFAGAKVKRVRHAGVRIPAGTKRLEGLPAPFVKSFSVADSDGAVVSVLANGPVEYLVVVNRDPNREMTLKARFASGAKRIRKDGTKVPVERYTGEYWLAPGDAEIFADR